MSTKILPLVVALAVLGVLSAGAWFVLATGPAPDAAALEESAGALTGSSKLIESPAEALDGGVQARREDAPLAEPGEAPDPGAAALYGRVVGPEGQGLAAEVRLIYEDREEPAEQVFPVDDRGEFEARNLAPLPGALLMVQAEGFGGLRRRLDLTPGQTLALGDLLLEAQALVRGRVVTPDGLGVAAAVVRDRVQVYGTADEEGCFELIGLPAAELWLYAEAEGYAALTTPPLRVRPGRIVEDMVLRMDPACFVEGVVVEQGGRPVAAAPVSASLVASPSDEDFARRPRGQGPASPAVRTAEDGSFRLGPLPTGDCSVEVRAIGFDRARSVVSTDSIGIRIELQTRAVVFGRVVDDAGDPVTLTRVQLLQGREEEGDWSPSWPTNLADSPLPIGHFELSARTGRRLRVLAEGPGIARTLSEPFELEENAPFGPLVLRAAQGPSLHGIVVDDLGRPLPGAEVRIVEQAGRTSLNLRRDLSLAAVQTDAEGRFTTPPLAEGVHQLSARREGTFPREPVERVIGACDPDEELNLVLDRGGWIVGEVRPRLLGVEASLMILGQPDLEPGETAEQDSARADLKSGGFRLGPLRPGPWTVQLREKDDRRRGRSWGMASLGVQLNVNAPPSVNGDASSPWIERPGVSVAAGEEIWLDLELDSERHTLIRGRLFWDGRALPFGTVQLTVSDQVLYCTTDRDGWFEFEGAIDGDVVLAASDRPGRPHVGHRALRALPGAELEEDLRVETGLLRGSVIDADSGEGLPGATVTLALTTDAPGAPPRVQWTRARSTEDGGFEFPGTPSGGLELRVSLRNHVSPEVSSWRLSPGSELRVGALALVSGGNLSVRYGEGVSFEAVAVHTETGENRSARSRRGRAYFGTLLPGVWTVEILVDGRSLASSEFRVNAGATEELRLD